MAVVRTLTTMRHYLNDRKALFNEKGMMATWNELKRYADSAIQGTGSAMPIGITLLGECGLATNFSNDLKERGPATGRPNDSAGGTIVDAQPQSL